MKKENLLRSRIKKGIDFKKLQWEEKVLAGFDGKDLSLEEKEELIVFYQERIKNNRQKLQMIKKKILQIKGE